MSGHPEVYELWTIYVVVTAVVGFSIMIIMFTT